MRRFEKCLVDTKYNIRFWLDVTDRKRIESMFLAQMVGGQW